MTNPKIRLFLVLGMAVAMLAAILWVGLILSASPVSADDGAPPDEGTTVDEGTPPEETPPATVQTDKNDYVFYEVPVITGAGFAANAEVTVTVTAPDGTVTTFTATTDTNGNWTANYAGPMGGGTFSVTASEGTTTATTSFTDPVAISLIISSDVAGNLKNSFLTTDTVYVTITTTGSGANPVNLYVVNDGQWTGWLNDVSSDNYNNVTLPTTAGTYTYAIWSAPTVGNYDIVLDENQNGWYDWGYGSQDQIDAPDQYVGYYPYGYWVYVPGFTVTAPPTPPTIAGVYSSNASGTEQNSFLTTNDVYAHITTTGGSPGGTISVNIYVTADQTTWTSWPVEDPLNDVTPGGCVTVNVPTGGGTFLIWSHFTTAGNYDIVVDVNKDAHYGCPVNLDVVDSICPIGFTVSKANANIEIFPYHVTYDGNSHTATGTATGAYGEDLFSLLNLTGTTHTNAGDYPLDGWSFAGNAVYNSASDTVHDIIDPKPASVTPDDNSKTYGDADPVPLTTGTLTGFLPADGVTATYSRVSGETVGDYTISATLSPSAVLANYTITYNTATFTINQAELTARADDQTITYGDPEPTYTITYSGFVSGDDEGDIDTLPTASVSGPHTDAGTYPITCSGGSDDNYYFTYVPGTLTIIPAPVTLTAATPEVLVLVVDWFGVWHDYRVTAAGVLLDAVYLTSPDGTATLVIPVGTLVLDADGQPLYLHRDADITVTTAGTPTAPEGTTFVAVYELLPNGTTFKYGEAQLIATYDPTLVPEGSVLVMAYYNEAMGQWVELETAGYVAGGETVPNTVFTHFDHLTYFALLAKLPAE